MASPWFFHYQVRGKEDTWQLGNGDDRLRIVSELQPAFCTVLDLSDVPDDNDWSKVRYRGPLYFDFDADGDIELACQQVKAFMGKLDAEYGFDLYQARYFASGSKGFHIEVPQECFIAKVPAAGYTYLPYTYRAMAEALFVDTLDLNVYTGKKGRQWRTPNVQRENGMFKVPLTVEEVIEVTPESYAELISTKRLSPTLETSSFNAKISLLFERSRQKTADLLKTRKKRQEKSSLVLQPWVKAKRHPPSIEALMSGEGVAPGIGFQMLAMQLAIYAVSVNMSLEVFLEKCAGLCEKHVSDSRRYSTAERRREELSRMYQYMQENNLYDFEVGPIIKMLKPGTDVSDLGEMQTEDHEDKPAVSQMDPEDGDSTEPEVKVDHHKSLRRGFFMNADGMFTKHGDQVNCICRATLRQVESMVEATTGKFRGFEFDIVAKGRRTTREALGSDELTSAMKVRQFFAAHQFSYQGGEPETAALLDIMSEKAARGGTVYVYPREGFFILQHPGKDEKFPVMCYLTKDTFISSISRDSDDYFELRYKPGRSESGYNVDIHKAPTLGEEHRDAITDLLEMNRPDVVADMLGWFVAAHYRSIYISLFNQFPLLQIYANAGSGKTQSVKLLSHLHWFHSNNISLKSAMASSSFALIQDATSSHSAPLIIDEFKPRELRLKGSQYAQLKDVFKASYVEAEVGNKGFIDKTQAHSNLSLIREKATAPIVFMTESIENETAIYERSVVVGLNKNYLTAARRAAFGRLESDPTALSALGKVLVQMGFLIDTKVMREDFLKIRSRIEAGIPDLDDDGIKRAAPRLIHNRAIITHALTILKAVLQRTFGSHFDEKMDELMNSRNGALAGNEGRTVMMQGMSEVDKVLHRLALLSHDKNGQYELIRGTDYVVDEDRVDICVERGYDKYKFYCKAAGDVPLFDSLDQFLIAVRSHAATVDDVCINSPLRRDSSSNESIVRLNMSKLRRMGLRNFRS